MKRKMLVVSLMLCVLPLLDRGVARAQDEMGHGIAMAHRGGMMPNRMFIRGEGPAAWLGVGVEDIAFEKAKELKLPGDYGVLVGKVMDESPAAKAGLAKGDIILELGGEKVRSAMQLRRLVRETPAGRDVPVVVRRGSESKTLIAKLDVPKDNVRFFTAPLPPPATTFNMQLPHPTPGQRMREFNVFVGDRGARLGISADELTSQLAQYFGVKQGKGILVREVLVGSAAEKAGVKAGDVIVALDGKEVSRVGALRRALAGDPEQKEKRQAVLTIVRDKREQTLNVELEAPQPPGPRRMAFAGPGMDPEEMQELAAEIEAHKHELEAQAREWQEEQHDFLIDRDDLSDDLDSLPEEMPWEMEKEIRRPDPGRDVQTGVV